MEENDNGIGFEFVCRAMECTFNDRPVCIAHTVRCPVIIGLDGRCIRYTKKENAVQDADEDRT